MSRDILTYPELSRLVLARISLDKLGYVGLSLFVHTLESTIQDTARFARAHKAFHHCHQCFILIRKRTGLPGLAPAATCALAGSRQWRWRCLRGSSCTAVEAVEALLHLLEALGQHLDALDRQLQEVHRSSCSFVSQTAAPMPSIV